MRVALALAAACSSPHATPDAIAIDASPDGPASGAVLIVEIEQGGTAFVDVLSNQGSPDVLLSELDAPLTGLVWADGWHVTPLDYVTTLGVHRDAFASTATRPAQTV